ncbi:PASTA domain-containing protein [Asticcacaulis sp. DXS10W]|uniref:PASTA domain-containing protein n=1 Tax=Asticcacaulis currens TaxID=2984210 RepID=A0ABT5IHZ4_9CAUL|nr:PASTA domain-containing protein [Asticcacaulis currens]MDC7695808.1 PASTA domain-containing protein [Asticcacaulis currens]
MQVGFRQALGLILCMGALMDGSALASPRTTVAQVPADKTDPCSPPAIRRAAAQQTAPALTGCRYEAVAAPVTRFFMTLPVARKTEDEAPMGTIIGQNPQAGQPLKPGGRLVLSVSTGRAPKMEDGTSVGSAGETSNSAGSVSTQSVPERPDTPIPQAEPPATPSSQASEVPPPALPADKTPPAPIENAARPQETTPLRDMPTHIPWLWIAAVVALVLFAGLAGASARKPRRIRGRGGLAPNVSLRLTPGAARLKVRGSLVSGRKGRS